MRLSHALRAVACVLAAISTQASAQWGPETPVTNTGADVWGLDVAAAGSNAYMVYGTGQVFFRSSSDEGASWSGEKLIDDGTLHLTDPMVADGDDVWVITLKNIQYRTDWCCSRDLGDLYLLHSGDRGATWDMPRALTSGAQAYRLSIAYAAGRLHLVWMDYRSSAWDTYYLRSPDRGATWEPERRIAISAGIFGAERPQVAARGDEVHVTIWDDRGANPACMAGPFSFPVCPDTFYLGSLDAGVTWGPEVAVAYSGAAIAGRNDIAVAGTDSVVITFNRSLQNTADANPHMFTVHSPDRGRTWDLPLQLTNTPGQADHGSIIGRGSNVHLAWHDSRDGHLAIYYALSNNEGVSWAPDERVSTAVGTDSSTPLDAVTPGFAHLVWLDQRSGTWQVYYRRRSMAVLPADAGAPDAGPEADAGRAPDAGAFAPDSGGASPPSAPPDAGPGPGSVGLRGGCSATDASEAWLLGILWVVALARLRPFGLPLRNLGSKAPPKGK